MEKLTLIEVTVVPMHEIPNPTSKPLKVLIPWHNIVFIDGDIVHVTRECLVVLTAKALTDIKALVRANDLKNFQVL